MMYRTVPYRTALTKITNLHINKQVNSRKIERMEKQSGGVRMRKLMELGSDSIINHTILNKFQYKYIICVMNVL